MSKELAVDSSIIVKWFKKGEEFEKEALKLRDDILKGTVTIVISEWIYLEVVRALVKSGFPDKKITQAYITLKDMVELGFIKAMPISNLLDKAKELEISLKLYAADAVNLAPSLIRSIDMLSEDKHLLRDSVKEFMKSFKLRILKLNEFYQFM
ncbi:PIN domain-containing protein [Candidatus Bathyarchaeota archaeon]|nr:PIN domain-containing protein [Candidatus Bathyarchaeota archaeon]